MRIHLVAALGILVLGVSHAQVTDYGSIAFLFDLSYSMSLQTGGQSRLDSARDVAGRIVSATEGRAQWSVLAFEDHGGLVGSPVATDDPARVRASLDELVPWGRSPLSAAVADTVEMLDGDTTLIVFSDLLDSEPAPLDAPDAAVQRSALIDEATNKRISVSMVYPPLDTPAQSLDWAGEVAAGTGGGIYAAAESSRLIAAITGSSVAAHSKPPADERAVEAEEAQAQAPDTHEGVPLRLRSATALDRTRSGSATAALSWILVAVGVAAAGYAVHRYLAWRRAAAEAEGSAPRPVFVLGVQDSDRNETVHRIREFPVIIGNGAGCAVRLPSPFPGRSGRSPDIRIDRESARAVFSSNGLFNINGAGKRRKTLKDGDRIQYGRYVVFFRGLDWDAPLPPPEKTHVRYAALPAAALALALVFRLDAMETAVRFDMPPTAERGVETTEPEPIGEPEIGLAQGQETTLATPGAGGSAQTAGPATGGASATWDREARLSHTPPLTVQYADLPSKERADILFIHAHPDDEALDYGAFLAAADAAGKRAAVLLFTDGNAGLDQYPWRGVGAGYPARRMRNAELSAVRITETAQAMTRLGVDLYIRLGLPNHPYSGIEEMLSLDAVLSRWGGEAALVSILEDVITRLSPAVVVAPDGPSEAYEHFEHEAVGRLTRQALASAGASVRVHLVPVDPLQTAAYDDAVAFDAWERPAPSAPRYRDVQLAALREHRTQRDASVIGIEVRQGLQHEYYRIVRWTAASEKETISFASLLAAAFD